MSKHRHQRIIFPIFALIALTFVCKSPEDKQIRVDITPLAVLETPPDMQLPTSDRVDVGLFNSAVYDEIPPLQFVEYDVLIWRNSGSAEYKDLDCRGWNNQLIIIQDSGDTRYYCETIAEEQVNEYTQAMGIWNSDIVIQKGDVFINIINYSDKTPDGKSEQKAVELIARVWTRRIQAGKPYSILPGEYSYEHWCAKCHSIDGSAGVGPTFLNLSDRRMKSENGEEIADIKEYIRTRIFEHQDVIVADYFDNKRHPSSVPWLLEQGMNGIVDFIISVNSR